MTSASLLPFSGSRLSTRRINITRFLRGYDALSPLSPVIHTPHTAPFNMSLRSRVDHVVDGLQTASHFWATSRAPLDNGGGRPVPSLLSRSLEEIRNVVDDGPPIPIADLVGGGFLLRVACGLSLHR